MRENFIVAFARPCYGGVHRMEVGDWLAAANVWASKQPNIEQYINLALDGQPIDMVRNAIAKAAIDHGVDILFFCDADQQPDKSNPQHPFVPAAFDFIVRRRHTAPTIVLAPTCTAPPFERPNIGRWRTMHKQTPVGYDLYTREEAAERKLFAQKEAKDKGMGHDILPEDVGGLGLAAIDMRIFTGYPVNDKLIALAPPWFYWEYPDVYHTQFVTGEDTTFTRDVAAVFGPHGIQVTHAAWDCWSNHWKGKSVGEPEVVVDQMLAELYGGKREKVMGIVTKSDAHDHVNGNDAAANLTIAQEILQRVR